MSVQLTASSNVHVNETDITNVLSPSKVIAKKGTKQVGQIKSAERNTHVVVCCTVNTIGNFLPPILYFQKLIYKSLMIKNAPPGILGLTHPSGWMTAENFQLYLKHFRKYVKCSKNESELLILDFHDGHVIIGPVDIAKNNGIGLLAFSTPFYS